MLTFGEKGAGGKMVMGRASGSGSALSLQPGIMFTPVPSRARMHPPYRMSLLRSSVCLSTCDTRLVYSIACGILVSCRVSGTSVQQHSDS